MNQEAYKARAYCSILSIKQLQIFLLSLRWKLLLHWRDTLAIKFASTDLYTWMERGTVKEKCLAQEHKAVPWLQLQPGLLGMESGAQTIGLPHLPIGH